MSFPSSPTNLQTTTLNGITWVYYSNVGAWEKQSAGSGAIPVAVSSDLSVTGNITAISGLTITSGNTTAQNQVIISNSLISTSSATGALKVTGGVGVGGNINVGSNVNVANSFFANGIAYFGYQSNAVTGLSSATIIAKGFGSSYTQLGLINGTSTGSTDYAAYADNGNDTSGWVDMGIAGSTFNDSAYTITKANDGYLFTRPTTGGGNLIIATSEAGTYNDIVFGVGSFLSSAEVARFHGNVSTSGNLTIKYTTASTGYNSGALQVQGGLGVATAIFANGNITAGDGTSSYSRLTNTYLLLSNPSDITPTNNPAAGSVQIFGRNRGGRMIPAFQGPSGLDSSLQVLIGANRIYYWAPPGLNTATAPAAFLSATALTTVGTLTARAFATTNVLTRVTRVGLVSVATVGGLASSRVASAWLTTGDGNGLGGFFCVFRFGVSDAATVSGARMFVGLSSSTGAATNVEPSTLTNSLGVAQLSTDATQWYFVYGGSVAQTAIALGTSLGAPTLTNTLWDLTLFASPNSNGVIGYEMKNVGSGVAVQGTITPGTPGTQTPLSTTALTIQQWRTNNATALAVGWDFGSVYVETDN